ncbi:MAG: hypothetical protein IGS48_20330 [Oscillatoriales cyanobacterium C42_A2020_001]|nr:hypothetical protein [Leptolyngbyaceae cyanobacterium C42_A2020_001]
MAEFILKVLVLSIFLSVLIKQGGPYLPIAATNTTALIAVLTPSIFLAGLLGWRWQKRMER